MTMVAKVKPERRVWYWHIHHGRCLLESSTNIAERRAFVKSDKPPKEVELRLRLMRKVKDQAGANRAWARREKAVVKAERAFTKAVKPYFEARHLIVAAELTLCQEAVRNHVDPVVRANTRQAQMNITKARRILHEYMDPKLDAAYSARDKAVAAAEEEHHAFAVALHAKECKNCPWDGRTIFPGGRSA